LQAVDRRERLRRLALETIDLSKDPYFMKNHLGQYECRLCLTLHKNEGNYLAHTQGKRHQQNLAKRAAREASEKSVAPAPQRRATIRKSVKIGRPGYRVTKQFDPENKTRSLLFQIDFPEIEHGERPRHRFMSAIEQKKETTDWRYQYLLFAAEPYETVCFKVPNWEVDKGSSTSSGSENNRFFNHWDPDGKVYSLQVPFKAGGQRATLAPPPPPPSGAMGMGGGGGGGYHGMMMHPGGGRGTGANSMMMPPPPPGMMRGGGRGNNMGMMPPPPLPPPM
jgi:splicing factor 3A subunit 2